MHLEVITSFFMPVSRFVSPSISNVVIGGTSDIGNDLAVSKETHDLIVERAAKIVPSIEVCLTNSFTDKL